MARKRGQNEGSIYQRKDGLWVAAISTPEGRKVRYAKTRALAAQKLQELQAQAAGGLPEARRDITVEALCTEWLEHMRSAWKPRTYEGNAGMVRLHIVPVLGSVRLADLTAHRVQVWVRGLGKRRLAGHCRATLRSACELAVRWGWLVRNPVDLTTAQAGERRRYPEVSLEQARAILAAVEGCDDYPVVCLLLGCGLRISEALGLRWQDWDAGRSVLHVAGQLSQEGGHESTKTRSGNRLVSVPSWVGTALADLKVGKPSEFIFGGRTRGAVYQSVKKRLAAAGIEGVRLHDLRHAYASLLIDAGVPITGVSAALGHASAAITMGVYAHKLAGVDTRTAAALEAVKPQKQPLEKDC